MQLCYTFAGLFDLTRTILSHGEDSRFNEFVQQARAQCCPSVPPSAPPAVSSGVSPAVSSPLKSEISNPKSTPPTSPSGSLNPQPPALNSPWNLYYRVTIADAVQLGLVDVINRVQGTHLTPDIRPMVSEKSKMRTKQCAGRFFACPVDCESIGFHTLHAVTEFAE